MADTTAPIIWSTLPLGVPAGTYVTSPAERTVAALPAALTLPAKSNSRKTRRISWTAAADATTRAIIGFADGNKNREAKEFLKHSPPAQSWSA